MHQACLSEFRQVVKQLADSWLALIAPPEIRVLDGIKHVAPALSTH